MSVKIASRRAATADLVHVETLTQLDALVGKHVQEVEPKIFWEDSYTQWRFDSLPEALEAMRDPFFSAFTPEGSRPRSSLKEVQEFPAYSTHLGTALSVVQHLSDEELSLTLHFSDDRWLARFGRDPEVGGATAPVAICLAALRSRGVYAEFVDTTIAAVEQCLI